MIKTIVKKLAEFFNTLFYKNLQKDFIYGLFLILPALITIWVVIFTVKLISSPIYNLSNKKIPVLFSFFLTLAIITLIGLAARNYIGKTVLKVFDEILENIPLLNIVYKSLKQTIQSINFQNKKFLGVVLVEYPRKDVWVIGFLIHEKIRNMHDLNGTNLCHNKVSVFMPSTPNPTTGFLIYADKDEVKKLDISTEEGIKIVMSAGMLFPKIKKKQIKIKPLKKNN